MKNTFSCKTFARDTHTKKASYDSVQTEYLVYSAIRIHHHAIINFKTSIYSSGVAHPVSSFLLALVFLRIKIES